MPIYVVMQFTSHTDEYVRSDVAFRDKNKAEEMADKWTRDAKEKEIGVVFFIIEVLLEE